MNVLGPRVGRVPAWGPIAPPFATPVALLRDPVPRPTVGDVGDQGRRLAVVVTLRAAETLGAPAAVAVVPQEAVPRPRAARATKEEGEAAGRTVDAPGADVAYPGVVDAKALPTARHVGVAKAVDVAAS